MSYESMLITLMRKYGNVLSRREIEQEILLARLRVADDNAPMVFASAKNAIIDELRRRMLWHSKMLSLDRMEEEAGQPTADDDDVIEHIQQMQEWSMFVKSLPYFVRKLTEIAEDEARMRTASGVDLWCRRAIWYMREAIRNRYQDWRKSTRHKPPPYRIAREILQRRLRKHKGGVI